ncbi:glycosyltransferase family 2 protein [soil metagenome]
MSVSVAMCTHNGAAFVQAQLDSILAQTRLPDEIVVVDDCSCDATWKILERVAATSKVAVRLFQNSRQLGITHNFEKAISLTTGEVVFLSDQDDLWHANKVETMMAEFSARPDLWFLHTDARLVDKAGESLGSGLMSALEMTVPERRRIHAGSPFDVYIRRNLATGATAALRRELFNSARPFPDDWLHDEWLAIIGAASGRTDFLEQQLVDYRQHDTNHMGIQPASMSVKLNRMFTRRGDFHRRNVRKLRQLNTHLLLMGAPSSRLKAIGGKLKHAQARRSLTANRSARLPIIAREMASGRYWKWSSGLRSMLRDLVESIPAQASERMPADRTDQHFDPTMSADHARGSKPPRS